MGTERQAREEAAAAIRRVLQQRGRSLSATRAAYLAGYADGLLARPGHLTVEALDAILGRGGRGSANDGPPEQ
jgi:hypothetical protein